MKKRAPLILFCCVLLFSALSVLAAPIPPLGPLDLSGTVTEAQWYPEKEIKGIPGMSGSAGVDRTIQAHFIVRLTDYSGVTAETALQMTRSVDWQTAKGLKPGEMPPFIILKIAHSDRNHLKKGMKIRVSGYTVRGDEGGNWISYKQIEIL